MFTTKPSQFYKAVLFSIFLSQQFSIWILFPTDNKLFLCLEKAQVIIHISFSNLLAIPSFLQCSWKLWIPLLLNKHIKASEALKIMKNVFFFVSKRLFPFSRFSNFCISLFPLSLFLVSHCSIKWSRKTLNVYDINN